jgi:hypothetical protein
MSKGLVLAAAVLLTLLFTAMLFALLLEFVRPPDLAELEQRLFPLLIIGFVFLAPVLTTLLAIAWRARHQKPPFACQTCGYDLRIQLARYLPRCPECGAPIYASGGNSRD